MLEGLFNQLAAKSPPPAMAVPPVPSEKSETKAEIEKAALSALDRKKLLAYLDAIDETDQDIIDEYLMECGKDAAVLARELQHADDCSQINSGDDTGLVQCCDCRQLSGGACQLHGWRVVVNKRRRCDNFEALQKAPGRR